MAGGGQERAAGLRRSVDDLSRGGAVELAIRNAKPFSFTGQGTSMPEGLAPADPQAIAALILP